RIAGGRITQDVVESLVWVPSTLELEPRNHGRSANHLHNFGRPWSAHCVEPVAFDEKVAKALRKLRAAAKEIGPQRGDHPDTSGRNSGAQRLDEGIALLSSDRFVKYLFELIAEHNEPRFSFSIWVYASYPLPLADTIQRSCECGGEGCSVPRSLFGFNAFAGKLLHSMRLQYAR